MKEKITLSRMGNVLGDFFLLQIYFLLYTLRGGLLFGLFPAFLSTVNVLIDQIYDENPDHMKVIFQRTYREIFKEGNLMGWLFALLMGLFTYDFYINTIILQNPMIKIVIVLLLLFALIILTHLPIVLLKFELKGKDYYKQAFFLAMASLIDTVSILLSLVLLEIIFSKLPILLLLLGAPLIALPFAWFSNHSLEKVKSMEEQ